MLYRATVLVYGVINILGGVIGMVMAKSPMSLIVGGLTGLTLIGLGVLAKTKPGPAFRVAGLVTLGLAGFWVFRFTEVTAAGKSPMMPVMNLALAVIVMAILAAGHLSKTRTQASDASVG